MVGQWQCTFTHAAREVLHRAPRIWRRVGEALHDVVGCHVRRLAEEG